MSGQVWQTAALGGYMYSDELSMVLRTSLQPIVRFRAFCDAKDATEKGTKKGDKFHWNVYSKVATRGRKLAGESTKMPETNFTITQGTLTLDEFGNSVPYSGKLDNLSKQPVAEIIKKVLKDDARDALDVAAHAQFNATPLTVQAASGTSTTAVTVETTGATITNNVALGKDHIKAIVTAMKERNIPGYAGDDYYALAWPSTFDTLRNDLESVHQYTETGFGKIMNGEVGRYNGMRFVEQTLIPKGGAVDSTTWDASDNVSDPWNNAKSDWVFFCGQDTVAEGIAIPEEIRGKIPQDFGRDRGVAWYYLGGFGLVHSDATQARILKWESAA